MDVHEYWLKKYILKNERMRIMLIRGTLLAATVGAVLLLWKIT